MNMEFRKAVIIGFATLLPLATPGCDIFDTRVKTNKGSPDYYRNLKVGNKEKPYPISLPLDNDNSTEKTTEVNRKYHQEYHNTNN